MFEPKSTARVFAVPLGVDFPKALVAGLMKRSEGLSPETLARAQLVVNTRRMARRIRSLFDDGPAVLLPQINLITDLGESWHSGSVPDAVPPLRRRLELVQLVSALLDRQPDLAPRSALYELADSLAKLMDEMHGQGVPLERIEDLDISDQSGHWVRIKAFLGIIKHYFDENTAPDPETRQRRVIEDLISKWSISPPDHPIIIAGSTGSRGTTQLLMRAVSRLPQGALVLPGFDMEMPLDVWGTLDDPVTSEDHPQYRFADLLQKLKLTREDIELWSTDTSTSQARNAIVSLALRPAPVTDQWLRDGPDLKDIGEAMRDVTLVEAPSSRIEALTIAMRLREAAEIGQKAALITPDRNLTRQVSAALDRWGIVPDDSAGQPLHLSPAGRFLRYVADLLHRPLSVELLLTILKHPLTHSGGDRGPHLRLSRELELHLRRNGPPFPKSEDLTSWAAGVRDPAAQNWVEWLVSWFRDALSGDEVVLTDIVASHVQLAEQISSGPSGADDGLLWQGEAGREARRVIFDLAEHARFAGSLRLQDYATLFRSILSQVQVRNAQEPHQEVLIWGTLEARVQGADMLILGGLNEGSWPQMPVPDPWLNRDLRAQVKLLLPERRIGLSAHDFQQAVMAKEVWLTRSVRSDDAETVPSRWLNRLQNLLTGLPAQGGLQAWDDMQARGRHWLSLAEALEMPGFVPAAKRPSPCPPVSARPKQLSVTQIKTLIRDPYAIYASKVLGLKPLEPLMKAPDALLRGIVVHKALENFIRVTKTNLDQVTSERFLAEVSAALAAHVPWAEARVMWFAGLERIADRFIDGERARRLAAEPTLFEVRGSADLSALNFSLTAKADRIDIDQDGYFHIYDYKTGQVPSKAVQQHFDKQLLLEAAIATRAGFGDLPPSQVARATFIGLGSGKGEEEAPLDTEPPEKVWSEFERLITAYMSNTRGYTARRALQKSSDRSEYDQLARFGEWDITDDPDPQEVS